MSDTNADKSFIQLAYKESELLLNASDLETLTARTDEGVSLPDVRLIHKPSGTTIDVSECSTQTQNLVIARIRMVRALAD